jgi:hypothetical protein
MKLLMKCVGLMALVFFSIQTNAQKIKLREGDISVLNGQPSINVEFLYDGMSVGSYPDEQDYIKKKMDDYNKKEPGSGDRFAKAWVGDRKTRFEPAFKEKFEEYSKMLIKPNSKYTLIFKTTSTEPGYNIYIKRKNAEIDAEVTIVETADRTKVIASISVSNAPGRTFGGNDYETGVRIAESYEVSGKRLGIFIEKGKD